MRLWMPNTQQGRLFQIYTILIAQMNMAIVERGKGMYGLAVDTDGYALYYRKFIEPKMRVIEYWFLHRGGEIKRHQLRKGR